MWYLLIFMALIASVSQAAFVEFYFISSLFLFFFFALVTTKSTLRCKFKVQAAIKSSQEWKQLNRNKGSQLNLCIC